MDLTLELEACFPALEMVIRMLLTKKMVQVSCTHNLSWRSFKKRKIFWVISLFQKSICTARCLRNIAIYTKLWWTTFKNGIRSMTKRSRQILKKLHHLAVMIGSKSRRWKLTRIRICNLLNKIQHKGPIVAPSPASIRCLIHPWLFQLRE